MRWDHTVIGFAGNAVLDKDTASCDLTARPGVGHVRHEMRQQEGTAAWLWAHGGDVWYSCEICFKDNTQPTLGTLLSFSDEPSDVRIALAEWLGVDWVDHVAAVEINAQKFGETGVTRLASLRKLEWLMIYNLPRTVMESDSCNPCPTCISFRFVHVRLRTTI